MSRLNSGFDLNEFKELFKKRSQAREDLVFMAQKAEAAERYDDMCKFMRELVELSDKTSAPLSVEERNLLSVAYKNVIGARRASWRTLSWESENQQGNAALIEEYKTQVEKELSDICTDILDLLENILGKNTPEKDEARVFYLKMTGDYYRYLAESVTDKDYEKKTEQFYTEAFEIAEEQLPPTHPIRLGLALNYSVCLFEILKKKDKACDLAKNAFDEAIKGLDQVHEDDYKDSTLIMQLLRDNLNLWTSSGDEEEGSIAVQDLSDEDN